MDFLTGIECYYGSFCSNCGKMDKRPVNMQTSISKHAFFDLSHVSPLVFLCLLRKYYVYGTCKPTPKFRVLQQQVCLVLLNNSHIGPVTYIAHCLCILPILDAFNEGTSHLVVSALHRFMKIQCEDGEDILKAKLFVSKLFLDTVNGTLQYDEVIVIKILQVFDINLMHIEISMHGIDLMGKAKVERAENVVHQYIAKLLRSESYMAVVDILIQLSIRQYGEPFLLKLIECNQFKAAEKWATFMGKPMLCLLVQKYVELKQLEPAYDIIKKNNLCQEFPELHHQSKESSLKKLAEKGVWDIAEARANGDIQLLEYLVYLALEAGYKEKAEELCGRHSLKGFPNFEETEANNLQRRYLNRHDLSIDEIVWVDEVNSLRDARVYFEGCKIIGLDCEWKPTYEKGSRPSKVSIMQIAAERKVYIFDLIKLHNDVPGLLDECLALIFHSTGILKLGYNFQCDIKQLSQSYGDLNCFNHFEMLLDIQNMFKETRGGLAGLVEKILGTGLNKTRRNSNWEERPLSPYQLEYAALDAAVLLHIFRRHVGSHTQPAVGPNGHAEWKSHIISHTNSSKKSKKNRKRQKRPMHLE